MERKTYWVLLVTVLVTILAIPSISAADGRPDRITESFLLGDTGCRMNVFMIRDGQGITNANVGPANITSPSCQLLMGEGPYYDCPPSPCCVWVWDGEFSGSWNCSTTYDEPSDSDLFLCTACTYWDTNSDSPTYHQWVTPPTCPPVPGPGGTPLPTCNLNNINYISLTDQLICEDCTGPPDSNGYYDCSAANTTGKCKDFTAVERNIMEKHGDNSKYCYYSSGYGACATQ